MSFFVLLYRAEVVVAQLLLLKSKGGLQKVAVVVFRAFLVILMIDLNRSRFLFEMAQKWINKPK